MVGSARQEDREEESDGAQRRDGAARAAAEGVAMTATDYREIGEAIRQGLQERIMWGSVPAHEDGGGDGSREWIAFECFDLEEQQEEAARGVVGALERAGFKVVRHG